MADPFQWDGEHVHLQWNGGSQHEMNTACGVVLSTWAGPNARGNSTEEKVGYTFEHLQLVDCPKCRVWMDENLPRCTTCGKPTIYKVTRTCGECVIKEELARGGK